jgi:hypothetical protein
MNDLRRDFKADSARQYAGEDNSKFKVLVTAVDHNESINDMQEEGKFKYMTPGQVDKRGYHISGVKLMQGVIILDIAVPAAVGGQFKLPEPGDVVWCAQNSSGQQGSVVYLYTDYAAGDLTHDGDFPAPQWGSMPGDYGDLRSWKDHTMQFSAKPDSHFVEHLPQNKATFITKYVRSITGNRWRKTWYEGQNVKPGSFILRGDNVFDIDTENMVKEVVEENGVTLLSGEVPQWKYPMPLNAPEEREERADFKYKYKLHKFEVSRPKVNPFEDGNYVQPVTQFEEHTFKNRYQFSYEPILDRQYKDRTSKGGKTAGFEREVAAREEYTLNLKGNNKIVIQDVHGDGEQVMIILKSHHDEGLAIVHNKDQSQVRIRDAYGQTVLIEGNKEKPRIILTTRERQVFEMGSTKGKGSFIYGRNGPAFGDSDVDWGRKTGKTKDTVYQQEFAFTSSKEIGQDEDVLGRMSSGMQALLGRGAGMFLRMADDAIGTWEKTYSTWETSNHDLKEEFKQRYMQSYTSTVSEVNSSGANVKWETNSYLKGTLLASVGFDNNALVMKKNSAGGSLQGTFTIDSAGINMTTPLAWTVNAKSVDIKSQSGVAVKGTNVGITSSSTNIQAGTFALVAGGATSSTPIIGSGPI